MSMPADASAKRPGSSIGGLARSQMRNIAPFATLIALLAFFTLASPTFATVDNAENILVQISVTGVMAVGLTFVILCAEIDLSFAAVPHPPRLPASYFTSPAGFMHIPHILPPGSPAVV